MESESDGDEIKIWQEVESKENRIKNSIREYHRSTKIEFNVEK